MRGGGRVGGRRVPYAAAEGTDAATIPPASRKLVQDLMGILADRSEAEIYATLLECGMDPDVAVERLISQGIPFLAPPSPSAVWCRGCER
ncbi:hypothetical protein GUJ93_ZPchr0005g14497 [Zizania palustris]|uniref:GBF-interacting protein 1 N-terminal domain-containing protein n=1 Tax=Zizania palustris TaxID=103762 RepID=A0A8J5SU00_ZIZPA|nr:hypothetical protein GUJ93_ZPchr0005g14497 [Zizania palustris]